MRKQSSSPFGGINASGETHEKNVVFGCLGTRLDAIGGLGRNPKRWEKWRPTVSLCQQPDLNVEGANQKPDTLKAYKKG
jgi:hypothetical protein